MARPLTHVITYNCMPFNPDDLFEYIILALIPIWGPFYAIFYILRMFWYEIFHNDE